MEKDHLFWVHFHKQTVQMYRHKYFHHLVVCLSYRNLDKLGMNLFLVLIQEDQLY